MVQNRKKVIYKIARITLRETPAYNRLKKSGQNNILVFMKKFDHPEWPTWVVHALLESPSKAFWKTIF
jgi:hypothetical protein